MDPVLSVRGLSTGYGKKQVLFGVSFDVMSGEVLLITGGNGSGKSTLLKSIYGLVPPWNTHNPILFRPDPNAQPLSTHPPHLNLLKGLAYLPQKDAVFDDLTVEENLLLAGYTLRSRREFSARREEVLHLIPAIKPLLRRKPDKMSGGERQIIALSMAILHRPKLLLLDEPLSGLDVSKAAHILSVLEALHSLLQPSILLVEHRQIVNADFFSRSMNMHLGKLEQRGLPNTHSGETL